MQSELVQGLQELFEQAAGKETRKPAANRARSGTAVFNQIRRVQSPRRDDDYLASAVPTANRGA